MEIRTMAALGVSLWLAASASLALAAGNDKAGTKSTPDSGEAKDAKPAPDARGVEAAGPHLRMADPDRKNPGKDRDLRHCLDLPTMKEVIRCSERKERASVP